MQIHKRKDIPNMPDRDVWNWFCNGIAHGSLSEKDVIEYLYNCGHEHIVYEMFDRFVKTTKLDSMEGKALTEAFRYLLETE